MMSNDHESIEGIVQTRKRARQDQRHQQEHVQHVVVALLLLLLPAAMWAWSSEPPPLGTALRPYQVPMARTAIIVDGVPDEPAWHPDR